VLVDVLVDVLVLVDVVAIANGQLKQRRDRTLSD
jgi:hypothetical protein